MIPKTILCPTDFSILSKQTLRYAAKFTSTHDARMTVMSVSDNFFGVDPDSTLYTSSMRTFITDLATLRDEIRSLQQVNVSSYHCLGNPATEICNHASKEHFDLIVIGSHGRTGFKKLLLGSVAETVIKKSTTNVLVVKPSTNSSSSPTTHFTPAEPKNSPVVVPYDFSEGCDYAVEYASKLFCDETPIIALNIAESLELPDESPDKKLSREKEVFEEDRDEFRNRMQLSSDDRISFRTHFSNDIAKRIASYCEQVDAKMVVIPSRKKSLLERIILGSTARSVSRIVHCPALIVKDLDPAAKKMPDDSTTDMHRTI